MHQVAERVKVLVAEKLAANPNKVVDSANFVNDLPADSLNGVELIVNFKQDFGCHISDDDAKAISAMLSNSSKRICLSNPLDTQPRSESEVMNGFMPANNSDRWTQDDEEQLRQLVLANAPRYEIAVKLERTVAAVKARAHSL
jgi:acyl carrier protein